MQKSSNKTRAAAAGMAAVSSALKVSTPGQVVSDRAFDAEGRPLKRTPVTVTKGASKAPAGVTDTVKGKAGRVGKGMGKTLPAALPDVVVPAVATTLNVSKPKPVGKREGLLATPEYVQGFNLARFAIGFDGKPLPWAGEVPVPCEADILAARALRRGSGACSGAELSLACMLAMTGRSISIEGVGTMLATVCNGGGGVRQTVVRNVISMGLAGYINPTDGTFTGSDRTMFKLPNRYNSGFSRCAAVRPTGLGLQLIATALGGIENVPAYMRYSTAELAALNEAKPAKKAKAAAAPKTPAKRK